MNMVALALFFIGVVLCCVTKALLEAVKKIWDDLGPLLHHEMVMRRIEIRLMIDDAGYECPDWLNDDEEDEDEEGKVIRLVPKQE